MATTNKPKRAMSDKAAEQWTKENYPSHVAARDRQSKTHQRAIERKAAAAGQPRPITRKQQKQIAEIQRKHRQATGTTGEARPEGSRRRDMTYDLPEMRRDGARVVRDFRRRQWRETRTYRVIWAFGEFLEGIVLGIVLGLQILGKIAWLLVSFALLPIFVAAAVLKKHRIMSVAIAGTLVELTSTLV